MTVPIIRSIASLASRQRALLSDGRGWRALPPLRISTPSPRARHGHGHGHGAERAFHASATRSALGSDIPPEFYKLMASPEAMDAIMNMKRLMDAKGVDTDSQKSPSMMQVAKMALDPEFRSEAKKVAKAIEQAGIDLKPEVMQKYILQRFSSVASGKASGKGDGAKGDDGEE